jgi:hypothetical protein
VRLQARHSQTTGKQNESQTQQHNSTTAQQHNNSKAMPIHLDPERVRLQARHEHLAAQPRLHQLRVLGFK